jgi:hypothetical protein
MKATDLDRMVMRLQSIDWGLMPGTKAEREMLGAVGRYMALSCWTGPLPDSETWEERRLAAMEKVVRDVLSEVSHQSGSESVTPARAAKSVASCDTEHTELALTETGNTRTIDRRQNKRNPSERP